jgi:hypothetical protein
MVLQVPSIVPWLHLPQGSEGGSAHVRSVTMQVAQLQLMASQVRVPEPSAVVHLSVMRGVQSSPWSTHAPYSILPFVVLQVPRRTPCPHCPQTIVGGSVHSYVVISQAAGHSQLELQRLMPVPALVLHVCSSPGPQAPPPEQAP